MVSHNFPQNPDQPKLFDVIVHNDDGLKSYRIEQTEGFVDPTVNNEDVQGVRVEVIARADLLEQALGKMAMLSRNQGFLLANNLPGRRADIVSIYKTAGHADGMVRGTAHNSAVAEAKLPGIFAKLFAADKLEAAEFWTPDHAPAENAAYYTEFLKRYGGSQGEPARTDARFLANRAAGIIVNKKPATALRKARTAQAELILDVSTPNAATDLVTDTNAAAAAPELVKYPGLTPREKLLVLRDDPRAGMLARTNNENFLAVTLLDYLDTPNGIHDYFVEVYDHQTKEMYKQKRLLQAKLDRTPEEGVELRSLTQHRAHELGTSAQKSIGMAIYDYHASAARQLVRLQQLETAVGGVSPTVKLTEAVAGAWAPSEARELTDACAAIVQFIDLRRLRERDIAPTTYDPLKNIEINRGQQAHPEKNKTVTDVYTAPEKLPAVAARLDEFVKRQTVKTVQADLQGAMVDRQKAVTFWAMVKASTKGPVKRVINELDDLS